MGFIQDTYKSFGKAIGIHFENLDKPLPEKANYRKIINEQAQYRIKQDIQRWRNALITAENIINPRRTELYRTYKDVMLDGHLSSIISSRKYKVLSKAFEFVDEKGEINEEVTKLFQKPWFREFCDISLDSIFWGHSLIQFGDIVDDGFSSVEAVPRWYVIPEKSLLIKNVGDQEGINYYDESQPITPWVLSVGKKDDLGLINKACPYAIYKKNVVQQWSQYSELFGMPYRVGKTDMLNESQRQNMFNALQNMTSAGYAVYDQEESIELISNGSTDAYRVYLEMITFCNSEISKLMQGQTMTSDSGSSRSQAEVHEKVADEYGVSDMIFLENTVNWMLLQKMEGLGIDTRGCKFRYSNKEDEQVASKIQLDNNKILADTIKTLKDSGLSVNPKWIAETSQIEIDIPDETAKVVGKGVDPRDDIEAEAKANLRGSVGGVQGILELQKSVAEGFTDYDAGIAILVIIYGFVDGDARKVLGVPHAKPVAQTPTPQASQNLLHEMLQNYYPNE